MAAVISSLRPAPALRHFVKYYYQVEALLDSAVVLQPVPARSPEIIEFMFADHYRIERFDRDTLDQAHASVVVGTKTHRHLNLHLHKRIDAFTIAFQPGGVAALFGIPSNELTNQDFDARDVFGPEIAGLRERLGNQADIGERARIADEFLSVRLADFSHSSPLVHAARLIHRCHGSVRVAELVERTGLGVRQFERRFRQEIGISPKLYSRIVRFESALRFKAAMPAIHWTEIAHTLGYHDQMHMIHDFRQLSGDTPTGISDHLGMFVTPEVNSRR